MVGLVLETTVSASAVLSSVVVVVERVWAAASAWASSWRTTVKVMMTLAARRARETSLGGQLTSDAIDALSSFCVVTSSKSDTEPGTLASNVRTGL